MGTDRLSGFTRSLRERTTLLTLGPAPALLVTPEGDGPAPMLLWLHGRTVSKEIDSARYLRLMRAGFATCAIDLPGHGEREDLALQAPSALPELLAQAIPEIDVVLAALREGPHGDRIRWDRVAIGGMSGGGMVTLRRLCDPHRFRCAVVEATAGDLMAAAGGKARDRLLIASMSGLDPAKNLEGWTPLPLLAMHSQRDEVVPLVGISTFIDSLHDLYVDRGVDPHLVRLVTWPETGALREHAGFGHRSGEARALLLEFLDLYLREGDERGA
jgi:alpha-beta hydrolase superfamily lysophospholipase